MCKIFVVTSDSALFSTGAPSNVTVASCRPHAKNHDNSFHACAFIIRQNNPIYASIMVLFHIDNKKECSFFEEIVVISCVCAFFVVNLQPILICASMRSRSRSAINE